MSESWATDWELALSARMPRAAPLRQFAAWPTGYAPEGQKCHVNADRWVLLHPSWRAMRGWVLLCNAPFDGAQYAAHSVVADPAGELWDVTLTDGRDHAFLEHHGDVDTYLQRVADGRWAIVREPLPDLLAYGHWSADDGKATLGIPSTCEMKDFSLTGGIVIDPKWLELKSNELMHAHVRLRDAVNRATRHPDARDVPSQAERQEYEHALAAYERIHQEWLDMIGQAV